MPLERIIYLLIAIIIIIFLLRFLFGGSDGDVDGAVALIQHYTK